MVPGQLYTAAAAAAGGGGGGDEDDDDDDEEDSADITDGFDWIFMLTVRMTWSNANYQQVARPVAADKQQHTTCVACARLLPCDQVQSGLPATVLHISIFTVQLFIAEINIFLVEEY